MATINLAEVEKKKAAEQQAAQAAAEQAEREAQQKRFVELQQQQTELERQRAAIPKESYQSGVEVRKDKIGRVRYVGGSSKGRLEFQDQVFPVYSTRYTEESQKQYDYITSQLSDIESKHAEYAAASPYYAEARTQYTYTKTRDAAEKTLEQLRREKAAIESSPLPTVQGAKVSNTQRKKVDELRAKRFHDIGELDRQIREAEAFIQTQSTEFLTTQPKPFEGIKYSSPSNAIGYNAITGRVEVGAGDRRGVVVSQSKAEDIMDLQRTGKEAGYTDSARVDPRIGVFKTVDSGIMSRGITAQPPVSILREFGRDIVTPQRERAKILTGQPDSKYANVNYVTREQQDVADARAGKQAETFSGSMFDYSSIFMGAKKPRELSQAEVDAMTPQQYEEYARSVSAYNAWVGEERRRVSKQNLQSILDVKESIAQFKSEGFTVLEITTGDKKQTVPIDFAYKKIAEAPPGSVFGVSPKDPILRKQQSDIIAARRAQFEFVKQVAAGGGGFVTITQDGKSRIVPIADAPREIARAKGSVELSTLLPVTERAKGPSKEQRDEIRYRAGLLDVRDDPLSRATYAAEQGKTKPLLPGALGEFERELVAQGTSLVGSTLNYAENISRGLYGEQRLPPEQQFYVSKSYVSEFTGGLTEGKYYKPTDIGFGIKADLPTWSTLKYAGSKTGSYIQTLAPPRLVAQFGFSFAELNPEGAIRAIPIRYTKVAIPVETAVLPGLGKVERAGTIIGAPRAPTIQAVTAAKVVEVGYGAKTIPILGRYGPAGGGKVFTGAPKPELMGIEKVTPPTGTFDALELAAYSPRQRRYVDPMFEYGEKTGVVKPGTVRLQKIEDVELAKQVKMDVPMEKMVPTIVPGTTLTATETANMMAGVAAIQKAGYVTTGKGSLVTNMMRGWVKRKQGDLMDLEAAVPKGAQKIQRDVANMRKRAAREPNIDKKMALYSKAAEREATLTAKAEAAADYIVRNVRMEKGRTLVRRGFNVYLRDVEGKESEILNIISPREQIRDVVGEALGTAGKPFGRDWPTGSFKAGIEGKREKVELYKTPYQSTAKAKAISGIQSAESLAADYSHIEEWRRKVLGGAKLIKGPKAHRYDKDPLDFYMLAYRDVKYQFERGDIKGARESVQAALAMRRYYTGTDFIAGAKQFRNFDDIQPPKIPKQKTTIQSAASSGAGSVSSIMGVPPIQADLPSARSASVRERYSPASVSARSAASTWSVRSVVSPSPESLMSARSRASTRSARSEPSPRSARSDFSAGYGKSAASAVSPKSVLSPSSTRSPTSGMIYGPSPAPSPRPSPAPIRSPLVEKLPLKLPPPVELVTPKALTARIWKPKTRTDRQKPDKPREREDFLGSSHLAQVEGFRTKKKDFDYGDIRTARLAEEDIIATTKNRAKFITGGKGALLGKSKAGAIRVWDDKKRGSFLGSRGRRIKL